MATGLMILGTEGAAGAARGPATTASTAAVGVQLAGHSTQQLDRAATGGQAGASQLAAQYAAAAAQRKINVKNNYAKATGTLSWSASIVGQGKIRAVGKLTDHKKHSSTSELILKWRALRKNYRKVVQTAGNGRTVSFDRTFKVRRQPRLDRPHQTAAGTDDEPDRCAPASERRGEPLEATARPGSRWLLVEQPAPWGGERAADFPAA